MTTATHNAHDITPERVLFVAFELITGCKFCELV